MRLRHARTELELHELSHRDGPALLLLHALGGSSADWSELPAAWPGSVFALDFCGHGRSARVQGGVYLPEFLVGDADVALAAIGPAALAGAGLGAYIALLLAGGRPDHVRAALLLAGRGLSGSAHPDFDRPMMSMLSPAAHPPLPPDCDPLVCALEADVRPADYVVRYAHAARRLLLHEDGTPRAPWWDAVRTTPAAEVVDGDVTSSLTRLAQIIA